MVAMTCTSAILYNPSTTPKQIKLEMDDNNKDALIASLQRRIKKLDGENKELREQLKVAYAEVYKKICGKTVPSFLQLKSQIVEEQERVRILIKDSL